MAKRRSGTHRIADIAQVSRGTVDRALHGRGGINEATRQRILEIARQIGYKPNLAARALSANRATAKIGVCIPREIHFFYDQLWNGVLEEAERVSQFGVEFINRPIQNLGEGDTEAFRELDAIPRHHQSDARSLCGRSRFSVCGNLSTTYYSDCCAIRSSTQARGDTNR